jgi:phage terminase small subunit
VATKPKLRAKKFTTLQQRFIDAMIDCGIGAKAARAAGITGTSAGNQACRWMMNDEIRAAVEKGREDLQHTVMFDAVTVLNELAVLATTDMSAFVDSEGYLKTDLRDIPPEMIACIQEITDQTVTDLKSRDKTRTVKVKLYDRIKAIQLAGNHKAVRAFAHEIEIHSDLGDRLDKLLAEMGRDDDSKKEVKRNGAQDPRGSGHTVQ